MNKTGIVTDPVYIEHNPGPYHPERPERLKEIYSLIEKNGLKRKLISVKPRQAAEKEICWVHSPEYYREVAGTAGRSVDLDPDTHTSAASFHAALTAAGGLLELTRKVVKRDLDNGFALIRPPGHHAERNRSMGFCLFNNVAIAAEYARRKLECGKVAIIDWDLHHGNGTMHSFHDRSDVLYISTHQFPYYPGTGPLEDTGVGSGQGFTVNIPLPVGMGDREYRSIFRDVVVPVLRQYGPDLILISAGFDTLSSDPLGGMDMSTTGHAVLMHTLMEAADETASGRLVVTLEGGYDVEAQAQAVDNCLRCMLGEWTPGTDSGERGKAATVIRAVQNTLKRFWSFGDGRGGTE